MHILIITDGIYPFSMGGSHRLVYEHCKVLCSMGHQVTCIVPEISRKSNFFINEGELSTVKDFKIIRFPINETNLFTKLKSHFCNYLAPVEALISTKSIDVINVQYLPALFSLRKFFKNNVIHYTFHGPWAGEFSLSFIGRFEGKNKLINIFMKNIFSPIMYWIVFSLEKYLLQKCSKFMVLSNYTKNILSEKYNIKKNSIEIIPAGVDGDKFFPVYDSDFRSSINSGKSIVFLTVRRLEKRMGLDILISACAILKKDYDDFILLIGGQGVQMSYLSNLITKLGLENNVKMLGFIPENTLNKYLSSSDLFILPSRDLEGFGLVVLESMACGTPILVSPEGGPPEVVALFDQEMVLADLNPVTISNKLKDLIYSNKLNDEYSKKCINFVSERYSWKRYSGDYINWIT
ncbi:glycosyltransferase family 4 protein [Limnohabitans sp. JirII-31]|uniref:glycosyltransferase family 4 protein n=1 Tax=Limnohabitans sp. JirII-31 TaxID=1977908 RepID=UPI000C1F37D0|nr:glycosyltransferase family 4 protein [Limnohabitans sp. JirII-31]PIT74720.1 hypothetical protein B9Z41_13275 [Limnohabitans sp. JirII-31]